MIDVVSLVTRPKVHISFYADAEGNLFVRCGYNESIIDRNSALSVRKFLNEWYESTGKDDIS